MRLRVDSQKSDSAGQKPRQLSASTSEPASWADFATGDKGGDVISLAAYVFQCRQIEAARTLAATLGVEVRQ